MVQQVIVTGAAGALGRAVVEHLAARGHAVLGLDLADDMPDCGQQGFAGGVDLAEPAQVERAVGVLLGGEAQLQGLVNIAGGFTWETIGDGEVESWDRMYRMNLRTALVVSRAALPALREGGGSIVNIGAQATARAGAGMGAYTSSKSGVARFTEALAEEEKDRGVRVNALLPSIIDTPANRRDMPDAEHDRWVRPEALAATIAFLLSSDASAITGAAIPVAGRV